MYINSKKPMAANYAVVLKNLPSVEGEFEVPNASYTIFCGEAEFTYSKGEGRYKTSALIEFVYGIVEKGTVTGKQLAEIAKRYYGTDWESVKDHPGPKFFASLEVSGEVVSIEIERK